MKANRPPISLAAAACVELLLMLASCVGPAQPYLVRPVPTPTSSPLATTWPPPTDWHDMPATAGTWQWAREGGVSVARFSSPDQLALLSLTCDQPAGTVTVRRAGQSGAASSLAIYTTSLSRPLAIGLARDGAIAASLPAQDPLLDAMAFSRGRFAVEASGLATLYLPSWPEVARVIEDCRG